MGLTYIVSENLFKWICIWLFDIEGTCVALCFQIECDFILLFPRGTSKFLLQNGVWVLDLELSTLYKQYFNIFQVNYSH